MDVRCEKCLTVYEFDDAQVGPAGVTVKCTQCGNLFKVRRRDTAEIAMGSAVARSPAYIPPSGGAARPGVAGRSTQAGIPVLPLPPVQEPEPVAPPVEDRGWLVRLKTNGEVYPFRDMTTLQQWIVERKVTRRDELSRDGAQWKALGQQPELDAFFQVVDDAAKPRAPAGDDPALSTTAPMTAPVLPPARSAPLHDDDEPTFDGPSSMGRLVGGDDPAFANTNPRPKVTPASLSVPAVVDELADMDLDRPAGNRRWPLFVGVALLALAGGGIYLFTAQRDTLKRWFGGGASVKRPDTLTKAHEAFLTDTDDGFRQAHSTLLEAKGGDETNPLILAELAEVDATWAWYAREDARALDAGGAATEAVGRTLRKDAQARIDEAKKFAADALTLNADAPEVNRAMADYQRVDGAPAAEVERYLKRVLDKTPADAEAVFIAGALAFRDGRMDEARARLEQANQLASATHGLARAQYLLAKLAIAAGKKDEARKTLETLISSSPQHDRARALLGTLAVADAGAAAAATPDLAPPKLAGTPPPPPTPPGKTGATPSVDDEPTDYNKLVEKADHQSENGKTDRARALYEKALTIRPSGVEAMTGLGYCDLDKERFLAAVDHFKQALAASPEYGEALIGLAEAYKVRGDKSHAVEFYKRYLKAQPGGAKAAMAQKNIKELQPAAVEPKPETKTEPKTEGDLPKAPNPAPDEPPL